MKLIPWLFPLLKVRDVHDGDTFRGDLDLGDDRIAEDITFRLLGIDAPELTGKEANVPAALRARGYLADRLSKSKQTYVQAHDRGNFGRWLAVVYCDGENVNERMLELGLAKVFEP